jgi:DNA-binding CsgD family transcriptional regulator
LAQHPPPLSAREREIANLVAQGLSNREISERLVMSTRTVEGHIYRACTKRGLRNRAELTALIGQSQSCDSTSSNKIGERGASNAAPVISDIGYDDR